MKNLISLFLVIGFSFQAFASRSSRQLIAESEPLFNKLKALDPMRLNMALKLADLYFDASVEINAQEKMLSAQQTEQFKKRSFDYYKEALSGMNGVFKAPAGEKKDLILFQMARLSFDLNEQNRAMQAWYQLTEHAERKDLKREAALRIAEIKELSNKLPEIEESYRLYDLATSLCDTNSLRAYVLYRKSWAAYRLGRSNQAVQLADQSLALARTDDQKQILTDLTLFIAHSPIAVEKAIAQVENYEKTYQKLPLVSMLAESYQTADQIHSFQAVTAYLNKKDPMLSLTLITLEQAYSEKNKAMFATRLAEVANQSLKAKPWRATEDGKKQEPLIFRTLVQLDGERKSGTAWSEFIAPMALVYIRLYPEHENFEKVIDGTLLSLDGNDKKIGFLTSALDAVATKSVKSQVTLRKSRLALAQAAKSNTLILEDSEKLAKLDPTQQRKYQFIQAFALKESNQPALARTYLEKFSWATNDELKTKTGWLYLQVLENQKDYQEIITFLTTQLKSPVPADIRKDWTAILEKAQFEQAVVVSNDKSLQYFLALCEQKKNTPLSCQNAESLALQQKNRPSYLKALTLQNNYEQLLTEYEKVGDFKNALAMIELQKDKSSSLDLKKLVYLEIVQDKKGFEKHLADLIKKDASKAAATTIEQEQLKKQEALYFQAAEDYSLLPAVKGLKKWPATYDLTFAEAQLQKNKTDKAATQALLKACDGRSTMWADLHQNEIKDLYEKEKKISLTGRHSEENFKKRAKNLQELIAKTDCFTQRQSAEEKAAGLQSLGKAYQEFSYDIASVPLPEGLTPELKVQVEAQIKEMSSPFDAKAADILKQSTVLVSPQSLQAIQKRAPFVFEFKPETKTAALFKADCPKGFQTLQAWQKTPENLTVLSSTQEQFASCHHQRIAAYFAGRVKTASVTAKQEEVVK